MKGMNAHLVLLNIVKEKLDLGIAAFSPVRKT
jgi:hypothetical protein